MLPRSARWWYIRIGTSAAPPAAGGVINAVGVGEGDRVAVRAVVGVVMGMSEGIAVSAAVGLGVFLLSAPGEQATSAKKSSARKMRSGIQM